MILRQERSLRNSFERPDALQTCLTHYTKHHPYHGKPACLLGGHVPRYCKALEGVEHCQLHPHYLCRHAYRDGNRPGLIFIMPKASPVLGVPPDLTSKRVDCGPTHDFALFLLHGMSNNVICWRGLLTMPCRSSATCHK